MKPLNIKIVITYVLLVVSMILLPFLLMDKYQSTYTFIIGPICSILLLLVTMVCTSDSRTRAKYKMDKAQTVLIITLIYLIVKFALGLFFGYAKSPYSHAIVNVIKNIWAFFIPVICMELIRCKLVLYGKNKTITYIFVTILFILIDLNLSTIASNFGSGEDAFKYISSVMIPIIMKNSLCTYLGVVGGIKSIIAYKIPITLYELLLPIFPDLDWFFTALIECLVPLVIIVVINRIQLVRVERKMKRREKKKSGTLFSLTVGMVLIFVLFVAGVFKYIPVAVLTYSMEPVFTRGDIVIIEKLDEEEISKIKVNDVIRYELDGKSIIHRVISIQENRDGSLLFVTKGDNNNAPDAKKVTTRQITGKAEVYIPKLGYPSVWFSEFFYRTQ